jgi:rod shape-determining protein MreB
MSFNWLNSGRLLPVNDIAVDLGTANTLVYVKGEGIVLNEPSVVAVDRSNGKLVGVGLEAKNMLGRTPGGIEAIRPLKDGVIADVDISEVMLRHFLKTVTAKRIFRLKPRVVIGVPSGITELERRAVRAGAQSAGAKEVYMVAEPMAAAIGVGLPVETPTGNMVIDIGGGTTEIAVIALGGIVSDMSIRVGGDEIDVALVSFLRKNYNLLVGEPTAEAIKIQIGSASPIGEEREMDVKGRDLVSGIPKTVRIHSEEVREHIQEPIQQIVEAVRRALEITPPELASDIVDRGIVMTGGGSLIRGLDRLLQEETNLPIHVDEEPLTCVVRGAGRILDDLPKYRGDWSEATCGSRPFFAGVLGPGRGRPDRATAPASAGAGDGDPIHGFGACVLRPRQLLRRHRDAPPGGGDPRRTRFPRSAAARAAKRPGGEPTAPCAARTGRAGARATDPRQSLSRRPRG